MTSTNFDQGLLTVAASLTHAWNASDSQAFASAFTADADFVNIYAMRAVGRDEIAGLHKMIFDTVYRGSDNRFTLDKIRRLSDDAVAAIITSELNVPQGPMAGIVRAVATAVFVRDGEAWKIAMFQNTREQTPPPLDPPPK